MLKFQAQVYRINDILGWYERKELILSPKFQRRPVWSPRGKSYLMDTIIRGYPLPQFFIREIVVAKERKTIREVVDGQQRLRTIIGFIDGEFTIIPLHNKEYGKQKFVDLPERVQETILAFPLTVNILSGTDDAEILEIFSRLNSYSVPLNDQEKLNALYVGDFKHKIDELSKLHLAYWERNKILSNQQFARMKEVELTAELVGAMLKGIQNGKGIIEKLYKEYDDSFPQYEYIAPRFGETLQLVQEILGGNIAELEFRRPPLFYSIFAAVYDVKYGLSSDERIVLGSLNRDEIPTVQQDLYKLNQALEEEEVFPEFSRFVVASASSTDKLANREIRHNILKNIVQKCFNNGNTSSN